MQKLIHPRRLDTPTAARLRRIFRAALSLSLAGAAGCARRISPDDFESNVCTAGAFLPLVGATPSTPVDHLTLRSEYETFGGPPPTPPFGTIASSGVACATATDPAACAAALAMARPGVGWAAPSSGFVAPERRYVVYTRGDVVEAIGSLDALARFLGPIDVEAEAAWLASERGYRLLCDGPNARRTSTGFALRVETGQTCGEGTGIDEHVVTVSSTGELAVVETVRVRDGDPNCVIGRRTDGADPGDAPATRTLGEYLARAAALEAASVHAFVRLGRELRAFGAPEALARAADRSARDEVRHAAVTARLARRHGGEVREAASAPLPLRTPFEVARENAVEGCVRETFGALQATYQAEHADDPALARAMKTIARDETRHAALSWDVAAWIEPGLTDAQRRAVDRARRAAIGALWRDLGAEAPTDAGRLAGVPGPKEARALHAALAEGLWRGDA
ncbi:MAG: ferritin-like domain-containing protein [Myxococcales bacterium]|nr:ferritin-like domain-containing protein [Myxococcales bacterium]